MKVLQKTLFLATLAVSLSAFGAPYQEGPAGQGGGMGHHGAKGEGRMMPSPDELVKRLTKELTLSEDQQTKIKTILEDQQKQMAGLQQDSSTPQEDKMAKFREIHQSSSSQIRALLNEDQQKKFDEMQQRMRSGHGGMGGNKENSPEKQ